jgi:hypothetical protein
MYVEQNVTRHIRGSVSEPRFPNVFNSVCRAIPTVLATVNLKDNTRPTIPQKYLGHLFSECSQLKK